MAPSGPGTLRTEYPTFVFLLIWVIVLVGALTFFPPLLGTIVQGLTDALFRHARDLVAISLIAILVLSPLTLGLATACDHRRRPGLFPATRPTTAGSSAAGSRSG